MPRSRAEVRIYLPATLPLLRSWLAAAEVPAGTGYAVTPGLRALLVGEDDELEAAATWRAALASLRLLGSGPSETVPEPRRVVLALDAPDGVVDVRDDLDDGAVRLSAPVPLRAVAAGMVDDPSAAVAVRRAAALIDAADLGDEEAELAVGDAEDYDLLWYATQELADL